MPYVNLSEAYLAEILKHRAQLSPGLVEHLQESLQPKNTRDEAIIELARSEHAVDGELEIDEDARISEGDDNGAYVLAWRWVDFAGTSLDKQVEASEEAS